MANRDALLDQLRIEREPEEQKEPKRWRVVVVSAITLLALAGAGIGWVRLRPAAAAEPTRSTVASTQGSAERAASVADAATMPSGSQPAAASLLDASGYVVARRSATVASKTTGRLLEVMIEEGQRVEGGQIIARLDDSNTQVALLQARAQFAQAEASLAAVRSAHQDALPIFRRQERQLEAKVISAQAFDTAKAEYDAAVAACDIAARAVDVAGAAVRIAERNQADTVVRAPFSGVVTVKAAQPGEIVSPSSAGGGFTRTGIGTIVDMESLEVEVDVSENFINRVSPSQPATVKLNAYPDWSIPAEVIAVIPTADRSKATVKVRVGFKSRDARVLPEMGARVSFLRTLETTEPPVARAVSAQAE